MSNKTKKENIKEGYNPRPDQVQRPNPPPTPPKP